eukprot:CAMPEP_0181230470 /NCGR_PEP_ID=MMETSP1096-20121128/34491_1 /TAXON_ID=156174 ORGANISM="Chrysochromulina ericina, Strain CCMP281" /NCGR_SAMPLE_ID=MMETSP1096 /ASSEMBLY_ACC=CAM_ASM_000453 /LENGTH=79 /DNA_ID=CAMNT_0023324249 /DNA_START=228 /DNA_END=467 /DNA_ORIENTATION=+
MASPKKVFEQRREHLWHDGGHQVSRANQRCVLKQPSAADVAIDLITRWPRGGGRSGKVGLPCPLKVEEHCEIADVVARG